jgi:hypothetical protein
VQLEIGPVLAPHFAAGDLADRLEAVELRDERTFRAYGLDDADIGKICRWALAWARDIRARPDEYERRRNAPEIDWDAYLDEPD